MVSFLELSIYKASGPLTRCKPNVDQKEWPCTKKWSCWFFFLIYVQKAQFCFQKKSSFTILLSSLVFASLIFLFSLLFNLNLSEHGCKRGEERETNFALRITHVFEHAWEAYCGHSSIDFARRMRVWGIVWGAYGVKYGCTDFIDRLLLGSCTEKESLRSELEWNTLHSNFCVRGWAFISRRIDRS